MLTINDIIPGKSYACKFKCETMLNVNDQPFTDSSVPLKGPALYESFGLISTRDLDKKLVRVLDETSKKHFIISFDDIWDIDDVEWVEET